MKKILKNKKGFTLIELLAVIVVLAIIMVIATQQVGNIIMVIATQQVGKAINNARANSFVKSYQMIVKQANLFMSQDETVTCGGTDEKECLSYYNLSNDYSLSVSTGDNGYNIVLEPSSNLKFKNLNLHEYGKYIDDEVCSVEKIGSNAISCGEQRIEGTIPY